MNDDGASKQVWVICYPKLAIKECDSNEWKQLNASFGGYLVKQ